MITFPSEIKLINKEKNRVIFEIGPFYPGYGVTIANSLRRVLLSSIEGAAATRVKIENVPHEFSTIPGVLEDVIDIILNIKRIRFKLTALNEAKVILNASGEKEVKAGDLELPTGVEVANPDQLIATLTDKKAKLNMEINVERGIGYLPVELRQKEKLVVGEIAVDAIFTPIKKVGYKVENIRVGDRTDFNKLILDIETDGTITPQDALKKASEILVEQFRVLVNLVEEGSDKEIGEDKEEARGEKKKRGRPKK